MPVYLSAEERAELDALYDQEIGPLLVAGAPSALYGERWLESVRSIEQARSYAVALLDDFTLKGANADAKSRRERWRKSYFMDSQGNVRSMSASRGVVKRSDDGKLVHHRELIPSMSLEELRGELRKLVTQRDVLDEEILAYRRLLVTYEDHRDAENVDDACRKAGTNWEVVLYGEELAS